MRKLSVRINPPAKKVDSGGQNVARVALNTSVMPIGLLTTPANDDVGAAFGEVFVFWIVISVGFEVVRDVELEVVDVIDFDEDSRLGRAQEGVDDLDVVDDHAAVRLVEDVDPRRRSRGT